MISRAGTLFFLSLYTAYSAPVEVPYVPEIGYGYGEGSDVRRNQTVSREAGPCRVSGLVEFSYVGSGSCGGSVCKAFRDALAQKLSHGEEVNAYRVGFGNPIIWCSYVMTFNSTTAMEAAGIHQFLRSKEFFLDYLSRNFSFPSSDADCQPELVTINRVTEPTTSLVAATTSVAYWRVGKKTMDFSFTFKFNPRADLPPPDVYNTVWGPSDSEQYLQYWQAMQFNELRDETQQLLQAHELPCEDGGWWVECHTSDTGAACECQSRSYYTSYYADCRAENCSRNCNPKLPVSCSKTFPPFANSELLSSSYNETLSALLVNGTKASFDSSELQVMEHLIEFHCHQSVEVEVGVEYAFEMLCPYFDMEQHGSHQYPLPAYLARVMSLHGLLWNQSPKNHFRARPFVRLVALESSLGNSSDAWVNVTQNYSSTTLADNYYDKTRPSFSDGLLRDERGFPETCGSQYCIRTPVHLSIHITRREPATEMWSPEAISVPCLVEQKAFELVVNFTGTGRMSDLRGDSYPEAPLLRGFSGQRVPDGDGSYDGSILAESHVGPVADVLWSRPGRQSYEMPQEELVAWRLRRNESGKPSDRHVIRSIQASNSSSLSLTLFPPAGGRDTTWSFCFFPADGSHIYEEICTASFPVRQSQAECSDLSTDSSIGQRLRIVWLFLFLLCTK